MFLHLTIEACEAVAVSAFAARTLPLNGSGLDHFADLATFVPKREINWQHTFARRGLRQKDFELSESNERQFKWKRKRTAKRVNLFEVFLGKEERAHSDDILQGDLVTYQVSELHLCYREKAWVKGFDSSGLYTKKDSSIISSMGVAVDLCNSLDDAAKLAFTNSILRTWTENSFLLLVTGAPF